MPKHHVFAMPFAKVYPLYVQKAEGKNRTKTEVDQIICWLTGYDKAGLRKQIKQEVDIETFFARAPAIHPNSSLIKGVEVVSQIPERDHQADRVSDGADRSFEALVTDQKLTKASCPREEAFDFPASFVAAHLASVVGA